MANLRAKVYLEWSGITGAKAAAQLLAKKDIHYLSSQDTVRFKNDDRLLYGLSHIRKDGIDLLAVPVWKWGVYYEEILRRMFNNTVIEE